MTPENRKMPDWARQDRQEDQRWIVENLDVFWWYASIGFEDTGRGAIVVDTGVEPIPGAGHPVGYFSQEQIEEKDDRIKQMVTEYQPTEEFVLVLLKPGDHISTYRVGMVPSKPWEFATSEMAPSHTVESETALEVEPPDVEMLIEWEAEGGCEAACPHGCWVEPDGVCSHGRPSWLLKLGLI